jgi:hypothetical protein
MNLQALKAIAIGMGVMIIGGLILLGWGVVQQAGKLKSGSSSSAAGAHPYGTVDLGQPAGSRLIDMKPEGGRVYLRFNEGGQTDRVVVVDGATGQVLGTLVPNVK